MVSSHALSSLLALTSVALAVPNSLVNLPRAPASVSNWPTQLAAEYFTPKSPAYKNLTSRWSTFEAPTFTAVFVPENEKDLSKGLAYLTANKIPILAKSGGHGYSTTLVSLQHGVMINMEKFNYSRINSDYTATIGSGADFNTMVYTLGTNGREANVGSCPCVGVMGATLGGGVGRLSGLHGLASDAVRHVRLALWNGTIVEASDTINTDLFWGLRGAGQNFGIVTEMTLETYPATNGGLNYEAQMYFNISDLATVIDIVNGMLPLDPALALVTIFTADPMTLETILLVNLVYLGPEAKGQALAKPLLDISISTAENIWTWVELPTKGAGGFNNLQCIDGKRQSLYGLTNKHLNASVIVEIEKDYTAMVQANPLINGSAFLVETFAVQGVDALPANYSAFPHRGHVNHFVDFIVSWTDDSVAKIGNNWAQKWRAVLNKPQTNGYDTVAVYQNYGHGDEAPSILYGTEKWRQKKLTALKNAYDPRGVFNAYHAIPSTLAKWT
ncbi:hypothetical protein F5B18DRAFT_627380 [Nemania serpens]|nr:hypothetical protein F5B18DRAFT_627380 [Nemania serpens]